MLSDPDLNLNTLATQWQEFYNKKRPHSSLNGKTPWENYSLWNILSLFSLILLLNFGTQMKKYCPEIICI
ncbi:integrase core domain-containing protein [Chryseobacterium cucumeris]|uniref:integrase core domain-containing protein n=1 Tax=Chryseobacterium cucumeris TaxID=1813611 RepID=UPI00374D0AD1